MRKLIFGINVTIDGCCDHTKGIPDRDVHYYFAQLTREAGTLLYGRKTYELMFPFWSDIAENPTDETKDIDDFAQAIVSVPEIVVFSKTLAPVSDTKTTVHRDNLAAETKNLKQKPGGNILVGGVDLPSQLLKLGLIDEVHLVVHPVIAGEGRRLFDKTALAEQFNFTLKDSKQFDSGCIALHYVKQN